jgi:putative ABC transport system permease protein
MLTILIMVVAGLGVLNTVALQIRERAHDIGVLKAIGMTPRQTLAMLVCSVAAAGLAAGAVAVPGRGVPAPRRGAGHGARGELRGPAVADPRLRPWELVLLALAGPVIAAAGALGPAGWAARARTAFALRAE